MPRGGSTWHLMGSERKGPCAAGQASMMSGLLQVPLGQLASQDGWPQAAARRSLVLPDGEACACRWLHKH